MSKTIPGTVMPYTGEAGGMFSRFTPMIRGTDGLSLGQVCALTGLESSTVQNWVKRGFVPHPVNKKYAERQLARILLISALRDCMKIEQIGALLTAVNGDADDESDDIVSEEDLYDALCAIIGRLDDRQVSHQEIGTTIEKVVDGCAVSDAKAKARLAAALQVMTFAYLAAELKREADRIFGELTNN